MRSDAHNRELLAALCRKLGVSLPKPGHDLTEAEIADVLARIDERLCKEELTARNSAGIPVITDWHDVLWLLVLVIVAVTAVVFVMRGFKLWP